MKKAVNACTFKKLGTAFSKHILPFVLLIAFLNTALFPSILVISKQKHTLHEVLCNAQCSSSLTEYLLEDCLQVYDPTLDDQEKEVDNQEKLYDEIDLLTHVNQYGHYLVCSKQLIRKTRHSCSLLCSCYNTSTPPPEFI